MSRSIIYMGFVLLLVVGSISAVSAKCSDGKCIGEREKITVGPDNPSRKRTAHVQTRFSSKKGCRMQGGLPCLKSFIEIDQQPHYPKVIENYNEENDMANSIEGSDIVPGAVNRNSIDLFQFQLDCDPKDKSSECCN